MLRDRAYRLRQSRLSQANERIYAPSLTRSKHFGESVNFKAIKHIRLGDKTFLGSQVCRYAGSSSKCQYLLSLVISNTGSSHFKYWLQSFQILAQVISNIGSSHFKYLLQSFQILALVISNTGSSHFKYWLLVISNTSFSHFKYELQSFQILALVI